MNRRQKIIVSVTGIFLVLLLLVGLTYAYFLTRIDGNEETESISVTTANLALVYGDGNGIIEPDEPIMPGTTIDSKTFTVKNEGNATTDYVVVIEDVKVTYAETVNDQVSGEVATFESNDFVYTLTCTSDGEACDGIDTETTFPITGGILIGNSIEVGKTHSYTLTVTYKETGIDQSNDMNKTLTAKVNIKNITEVNPYSDDTSSLAYNIINNAISVTTAEKEDGYAELLTTPKTTVAASISETYATTGYEVPEDKTMTVSTTYQGYYWTYGTDYTIDPVTGKFTLTGVSTCKYNDGTCHETLVGKYIVSTSGSGNSSSTDTQKNTTNVNNIYKVTTAPASSSASITVGYRAITNMPESTLSVTQDDLGISYYYRGAVKNNYLTFNNMCWRIVRIEGDGAIKIVLADDEAGCSTSTLSKTDSAFIGTGDYGYTTNDSGQYFADYENSAARTTSMKYKFNEWFNTNLSSVSSKLKTTQACIGDITTKYDGNGAITTSTSTYYYDSYVRLSSKLETRNATLICGTNGGKTSETQIFPLTADEVVFAGGNSGSNNFSYYLRENAIDNWRTLTPSYFTGDRDYVFILQASGLVYSYSSVSAEYPGLRPAVSLISGTQIASGDGSIENPYTIK